MDDPSTGERDLPLGQEKHKRKDESDPHLIHLQEQYFMGLLIYCLGKCEAMARAHLDDLLQAWSVVSMNESFTPSRCREVPGHGREDGELVVRGETTELGFFSSARQWLRGEMSAGAHER